MKISKSLKIYTHIILAFFLINSLQANTKLLNNVVIHDKPIKINQLRFKDVNLQDVDLTGKKGNIMILNFWASWCAPCRAEHKYLMKIKEKSNKLKILGVNFKDKEKDAKKFMEEFGNPYYFLAKDYDGRMSINFGIYGIPESILVDKNLTIIKKFIGPINHEDFNSILKLTR